MLGTWRETFQTRLEHHVPQVSENSVDAVQPVPSPTCAHSSHTMGPDFLLKIVATAERVQ